jgi:hypothetical protein
MEGITMVGFLVAFIFSFACSTGEDTDRQTPFLTAEEAEELLNQSKIVNTTVGNIRHQIFAEAPGSKCSHGGYKIATWADQDPEDGDNYNAQVDTDYTESYSCFNVSAIEHANLMSTQAELSSKVEILETLKHVKTTKLAPVQTCSPAQEGAICCQNGGVKITTWSVTDPEPGANDLIYSRLICKGRAGQDAGGRGLLIETVDRWSIGSIPDETARLSKQTECVGFLDVGQKSALASCWSDLMTQTEFLGVVPGNQPDCTYGGLRFVSWSEDATMADGEIIPTLDGAYSPSSILAYLDSLSPSEFNSAVLGIQNEIESRKIRYFCNSRPIFSFQESFGPDPLHSHCPAGGRRLYYGYPSFDNRSTPLDPGNPPAIPPSDFVLAEEEYTDPSLILDDFYVCNPGYTEYVFTSLNNFMTGGFGDDYPGFVVTDEYQTALLEANSGAGYCPNDGNMLVIWANYTGASQYSVGDGIPAFIPICDGADGSNPGEYIVETLPSSPGVECSYGGVLIRSCRAVDWTGLDGGTGPGDVGADLDHPNHPAYVHLTTCAPGTPHLDPATVTSEVICNGSQTGFSFDVIERDSGSEALFLDKGCLESQKLLIRYKRFRDVNGNGDYDDGVDSIIGSEEFVCSGIDGESPTMSTSPLGFGHPSCAQGGTRITVHHPDGTEDDVDLCTPHVVDLEQNPAQRLVVEDDFAKYVEFIEQCHGPGLVYQLRYSDGASSSFPVCWGVGATHVDRVKRDVGGVVEIVLGDTRDEMDLASQCDAGEIEIQNVQITYESGSVYQANFDSVDYEKICVPNEYSGQVFSGIMEYVFPSTRPYTGLPKSSSELVLQQECPGGGILVVPYYGSISNVDETSVFAVCHKRDVATPLIKEIDEIEEYKIIDSNYLNALDDCPFGGRVYQVSYKNASTFSYFGVCSGGMPGKTYSLPSDPFGTPSFAACVDDGAEQLAAMKHSRCDASQPANHACTTIDFGDGGVQVFALCDVDFSLVDNTVLANDKSDPAFDLEGLRNCPAGGRVYSFRSGATELTTQAVCHHFLSYTKVVSTSSLSGAELTTHCPHSASGSRLDICMDYDGDGVCTSPEDWILNTHYLCDSYNLSYVQETIGLEPYVGVEPGALMLESGDVSQTHVDQIFVTDAGNSVFEVNPCVNVGGYRTRAFYDLDNTSAYNPITDEWVVVSPVYTGSFNFQGEPTSQARWSYVCNGSNSLVERRTATMLECPTGGEILTVCRDANNDGSCDGETNVEEFKICQKGAPGPIFNRLLNISEGSIGGLKWDVLGVQGSPSYLTMKLAYSTNASDLDLWNPMDVDGSVPASVTVLTKKQDCLTAHSVPEFNQTNANERFSPSDFCAFDLSGFDPWEEVFVRFVAVDSGNKGLNIAQRIFARVPNGMVYVAARDWPEYQESYGSVVAHGTTAGRDGTTGPFSFAIDKWPVSLQNSPIAGVSYPAATTTNSYAVSARAGDISSVLGHNFAQRKQLCYERSFQTGYQNFVETPQAYTSSLAQTNPARYYHLATNLEWFVSSFETPKVPLEPLDSTSTAVRLLMGLSSSEFPCWIYNDGLSVPDSTQRDQVAYAYSQFRLCLSRYGAFSMIGNRSESTDGLLPANATAGGASTLTAYQRSTDGVAWTGGQGHAYTVPSQGSGVILGANDVLGGLPTETDGGSIDTDRIDSIYHYEGSLLSFSQSTSNQCTVRGQGFANFVTNTGGRYSLRFRQRDNLSSSAFRCALVAPTTAP